MSRFCAVCFAMLAFGVASGCVKSVVNEKVPSVGTRYDVYGLYTDALKIQAGYGAYTYVLFNRDVSGLSCDCSDEVKLLCRVLEEIQYTTLKRKMMIKTVEKEKINLFSIPVHSTEAQAGIENYDATESMRMLISLRTKLGNAPVVSKLRGNAGPFLVTFPQRYQDRTLLASVLIADLSNLQPSSVHAVIKDYKQDLSEGINFGVSEYKSYVQMVMSSLSFMGESLTYFSVNHAALKGLVK